MAFGGLKICNCRLFAEKTFFAAMPAGVLALQQYLQVIEYPLLSQSPLTYLCTDQDLRKLSKKRKYWT